MNVYTGPILILVVLNETPQIEPLFAI